MSKRKSLRVCEYARRHENGVVTVKLEWDGECEDFVKYLENLTQETKESLTDKIVQNGFVVNKLEIGNAV